MNLVWIELAVFHNLFHFNNGYFTGHSNHWIEVARGVAVHQITRTICLPRLY
jgi:hypothetical protein